MTTPHSLACGCPVCQGTISPELAAAQYAAASTQQAPVTALANTFLLNSLAGANHTIYLDFTGHTTTGTLWNSQETGGQPINSPAYDTDGNINAFSDSELINIQNIWQRVAEDFAPFFVNVTTQEPPEGALVKSGGNDITWGIRVVIGGSWQDWLGRTAGGIAWLGSFNWSTDTPVFVFSKDLGNGHDKYTAEAVTHEVGHALGLQHDGAPGTSYYEGHGSGATGWAPIMGVGYYRTVTQWSRGQYAGATNTEDDLEIITTRNGFGYRPDDVGDTPLYASVFNNMNGSTATAWGIISHYTDKDVFSFTTATGTVSFTVNPAPLGGNLDILAEIIDASGNVLASANPSGSLSASVSASVTEGTYYLRISGAGEPNGWYDNYGSLGQYYILGEVPPPITPPIITINNVAFWESAGWARLVVSLSHVSDKPVAVTWRTADGQARYARDYYARAGRFVFQPGETRKLAWVLLINDNIYENTERFWIGLSDPVNATIGREFGALYILDDDPPPTTTVKAPVLAAAAGMRADAAPGALAWYAKQLQQRAGFTWTDHSAADDAADSESDLLARLAAVA